MIVGSKGVTRVMYMWIRGLCVMVDGMIMMPKLSVENLASTGEELQHLILSSGERISENKYGLLITIVLALNPLCLIVVIMIEKLTVETGKGLELFAIQTKNTLGLELEILITMPHHLHLQLC